MCNETEKNCEKTFIEIVDATLNQELNVTSPQREKADRYANVGWAGQRAREDKGKVEGDP